MSIRPTLVISCTLYSTLVSLHPFLPIILVSLVKISIHTGDIRHIDSMFIKTNTLLIIVSVYPTRVRSFLEYSPSVWDPHTNIRTKTCSMLLSWPNDHRTIERGCMSEIKLRTTKYTRHLNSKAFHTTHTSKCCYKYAFLPRTNNILEFTNRQNSHYQRTTQIQISFN